jgi:hypothetical protein
MRAFVAVVPYFLAFDADQGSPSILCYKNASFKRYGKAETNLYARSLYAFLKVRFSHALAD